MNATLLSLSLSALLVNAAFAGVQEPPPRIEACFVLDTTGSMGGLIQGAKEKIWSIVQEMKDADPVPDLKIGLIGYRDWCQDCRRSDSLSQVQIPYAAKLLFQELMGMNVIPRLTLEEE